ncbi:hypothetical protein D3C87_105700 [compost metagenome]
MFSFLIMVAVFINYFGGKCPFQESNVDAFVKAVDAKTNSMNFKNTKLTRMQLEKSSVEVYSDASGNALGIYENPARRDFGLRPAVYFFENDSLKLILEEDASHREIKKYIMDNKVVRTYRRGKVIDCFERCYYGLETRGFQLLKKFRSMK